MKTIKIKDEEYIVRYSLRSIFLFEAITKKPFSITTLTDNYVYFYCIILAANPTKTLEWDDFVNALEDNPELFRNINDIIEEEQKQSRLTADETKSDDGKKK